MLVVALLVVLLDRRGVRFNRAGAFFVAMTFPGTLILDEPFQSLLNWTGWVLIFLVLGPGIKSVCAQEIRLAAWTTFKYAFIAIAILSSIWFATKMPSLGRGVFTGVMIHSMLVGPIAAMAVVFCVHMAIAKRSLVYCFATFLSLIPCILSGSRSAVTAMTAVVLVLLLKTINSIGMKKSLPMVAIALLLGGGGVYIYTAVEFETSYRILSNLEAKGLQNTREDLWAARLNEFQEYPLTGVGMGVGILQSQGMVVHTGVVQTESNEINIEPGSSWLALLSMTGLSGTMGFVILLIGLFRDLNFKALLKSTNSHIVEIFATVVFLTLHMVAEGYIFASGNAFCLLFWLTLGRMQDLASVRSDKCCRYYLAER
ncbi:O-antigen ligase [Desulfuromonas soudanensis]|uniref:O-antigen ligase n=1 Tax=Desulfuromonas soudanensis TaxID=1603606 RepID=A0A0M4D3H9_9BACT|nr:O-antigen ligase family protein [Desulfuromonas soudanensis]ALC17038.1 O-antigen ligase [Desulfuromonas soudanensis]